jgi:hypothetical protein
VHSVQSIYSESTNFCSTLPIPRTYKRRVPSEVLVCTSHGHRMNSDSGQARWAGFIDAVCVQGHSSGAQPGDLVEISGLKKAAQHNGKTAVALPTVSMDSANANPTTARLAVSYFPADAEAPTAIKVKRANLTVATRRMRCTCTNHAPPDFRCPPLGFYEINGNVAPNVVTLHMLVRALARYEPGIVMLIQAVVAALPTVWFTRDATIGRAPMAVGGTRKFLYTHTQLIKCECHALGQHCSARCECVLQGRCDNLPGARDPCSCNNGVSGGGCVPGMCPCILVGRPCIEQCGCRTHAGGGAALDGSSSSAAEQRCSSNPWNLLASKGVRTVCMWAGLWHCTSVKLSVSILFDVCVLLVST